MQGDPGYGTCDLCHAVGKGGNVGDWTSHFGSNGHKRACWKLSGSLGCGSGVPWGAALADPRWTQSWWSHQSRASLRVHFATGLVEHGTF